MLSRRRLLPAAVLCAFAAFLAAVPASASSACDRVVAVGGDDAGPGTAEAPYATVERLVAALAPGQIACVRGVVAGDAWIKVPGATLTSEPGRRGTIRGQVVVDAAATGVTVSDLVIDGSGEPYPTPTIYGDDATFARNDVSNGRQDICFQIGPGGEHQRGPVARTLLVGNRIHDCGVSNNHRHGVYVASAVDTRIIANEIFDNGDRGIQLFPDAQRTEVAGNVIDGNGEGIAISSDRGMSTNGSRVHHNVISNSTVRGAVESYTGPGSSPGRDNVVERNCIWGRGISEAGGGFVARDNVVADPQFLDRAAKDLRPAPGSPCAAILAHGRRVAGTAHRRAAADRRDPPPRAAPAAAGAAGDRPQPHRRAAPAAHRERAAAARRRAPRARAPARARRDPLRQPALADGRRHARPHEPGVDRARPGPARRPRCARARDAPWRPRDADDLPPPPLSAGVSRSPAGRSARARAARSGGSCR